MSSKYPLSGYPWVNPDNPTHLLIEGQYEE
jgi:hypothetical protein